MKTEFTVECGICEKRYENHVGSTPCCGAVSLIVENGKVTQKASIYVSDKDIQEGVQMVQDKIAEAEMIDHRNWMLEESKRNPSKTKINN